MDNCPHCGARLIKVEKTGPGAFTATDQDTGAAIPIPADVQAIYASEGNIPLSYACQQGWPLSYRGVPNGRGTSSRNGAQHISGVDMTARAGELPGVFVQSSHPVCVEPFATEYADRVR